MEKILNSSSSKVVSISSGNVIAEAVSDEYAFGTSIRKYNVNSITFLDGYDILPLDSEPNIYSHDISENGDGCVMLYADYSEGEMYHVYIVGEGGVDANPNSSKLFYDFKNCTSIDFNDCFYTSNVTTMIEMFYNCQELTELDLSSFDTSNVSDMSYMFYRCRSLTELDLSSFNTSNVTNMRDMFYCCRSLTELNLSSFDTSNVTDMCSMFEFCRLLTELDLSNFNTSNVINMRHMFNCCMSLTVLDLSSFNTSNVIVMDNMFYKCKSLTEIYINNFDMSKSYYQKNMFDGCPAEIKEIKTTTTI